MSQALVPQLRPRPAARALCRVAQPVPVAQTDRMPHTVSLELRIDMPVPAEKVWDAITDWTAQGEWMVGTRVWVSGGDGRSNGSEVSAFTGVGRFGFLDTMTITVWQPPHRCEVLHTGRVVRGTGWMATAPRGGAESAGAGQDAGCVFIWGESLELPLGWLGRIGWVVVGPLMKAGVRASLKRFRATLQN